MKELKYQHICRTIKAQIAEGFWNPGDKIFSERQLAEIHDVSRLTIKRALAELVSEGLLEYKTGKQGTFVASIKDKTKIEGDKNNEGFIVVAVDNHTPAFASHILQGIHEGLWENGYHTVYCNTYQEGESIVDQIRSLISTAQIKGLIYTPVLGPRADQTNNEVITLLENRKIPYVLVDRFLIHREDNRVVLNNREIFRSLAELLKSENLKNILLVNGFDATSSNERVQGVLDIYSSGDSEFSCYELVVNEKELYLNSKLSDAVYHEIEERGPFSAVIGINQQLLEAGKQIVQHLNMECLTATIVTSNREQYSDISVVQPITRMGKEAALLLLRLIKDPEMPITQLVLKAHILDNRKT